MRRIAAIAGLTGSVAALKRVAAVGSIRDESTPSRMRGASGHRMPLVSRAGLAPTPVALKQKGAVYDGARATKRPEAGARPVGRRVATVTSKVRAAGVDPAEGDHVKSLLMNVPKWKLMTAEQFQSNFKKWLAKNKIDEVRSANFIAAFETSVRTITLDVIRSWAAATLHVLPGKRTICDAAVETEYDLQRFKLVMHATVSDTLNARHTPIPAWDNMSGVVEQMRKAAAHNKVVVLRGESGCGKTSTAFLAGADGVTVYVVPSDSVQQFIPNDAALMGRSTAERNEMVRKALCNHIDHVVGKVECKIAEPITLVLDEMGGHPLALRAVCSLRRAIASKLSEYTTAVIRIIVAGTGVAQRGYAIGSSLTTFTEIDIPNDIRTFTRYLETPEMQNLKAALQPRGDAPSAAALALMILAGNRRFAAIIAQLVCEHTWWSKTGHELRDNQLWQLFQQACGAYHLKNGFCDYTADECNRAFSRAFHISFTQNGSDLSGGDNRLAEKLGLLLDNAKAFLKRENIPDGFRLVRKKRNAPHILAYPAAKPRYTMSSASALLGMSLFGEISGGTWEGFESNIAHVLQIVCAAAVHSAEVTGKAIQEPQPDRDGWCTQRVMAKLVKIFEQLEGRALPSHRAQQVPRVVPRVVSRQTHLRLAPADIARLLTRKFPPGSLTPRERDLKEFHDWIRANFADGNKVVVLNGPSAPGPDIFLAGEGWYLGVQCKMYTKTEFKPSTDVDAVKDPDPDDQGAAAELAKMDLQLPSTAVKQRLLVVVAGRKPAPVRAALLSKGDFVYLGANTKEAGERLNPLCVLVGTRPATSTSRYVGHDVPLP